MSAPPVRTLDNVLVLIAAAFVAGAVIPWHFRLACGILAVVVLFVMAYVRFRNRTIKVRASQTVDTYAAVARIRSERKKRFERNRPPRRG